MMTDLFFLFLGCAGLYIVILDFKNSHTTALRGMLSFHREKNPLGFWMVQIANLLLSLAMILFSVAQLMGLTNFSMG